VATINWHVNVYKVGIYQSSPAWKIIYIFSAADVVTGIHYSLSRARLAATIYALYLPPSIFRSNFLP
jgi:hypothetical protein